MLIPLTTTSPHQALASSLHEQAFPYNERRDTHQWLAMVDAQPIFHIDEIIAANKFAGFISYWQFTSFCYVEHFAILSELRGGGLGGRVIEELIKAQSPKPLVLEIEPPTSTITRRRQNFYARQGFSPSSAHYLQPPYHKGEPPLPLTLMTTDAEFLSKHLNDVVHTIYHYVYGVNNEKCNQPK